MQQSFCAGAAPRLHSCVAVVSSVEGSVQHKDADLRSSICTSCWQVTHDVSHLTCADFLRAPGVQTPVIVRFSTVIHERGSPETLRDPRGFAVKFYTREGNWDLVRSTAVVGSCLGPLSAVLTTAMVPSAVW